MQLVAERVLQVVALDVHDHDVDGDQHGTIGNGQDLDTLLGKMLRIDVDRADDGKAYGIPKDNPFVRKAGAQPEIWSYGHRNVQGLAWDSRKRLWASEFGLALGQVACAEKSNEITAIPALLRLVDIKGAIITIDAPCDWSSST